jgi:hypothetical protein
LAVDEDPCYLSILAEKLFLPQCGFLAVFLGDTNHIQEVGNDHSELLEAHQVLFLSVTQRIRMLIGQLTSAARADHETRILTALLLLLAETGVAGIAHLNFRVNTPTKHQVVFGWEVKLAN